MSATNVVIRKRITRLFLILGAILVLLICRLAWIQFVRGDELRDMAEANRMDDIPVPAKRGAIYDRNGVELVKSISSNSICAFPPEVKRGSPEKTARELADILGLKYEDVYKKLTKGTNFEYIKRRVDDTAAVDRIKKLDLPGIDVVEESQRSYPKGAFASHILGIVGTDNIGLEGLEMKLDKDLRGVRGRIITEKDARGRMIPQATHDYEPPVPGNNVWLTIDQTIQYFVERELNNVVAEYQPKGATVIVMDPKTGQILALANRPDFDPGNYRESPAANRHNMALELNYEPGSTFKVVTASSALEEGVVHPEDRFFDPGYIAVADRKIRCWKAGGHGAESFLEVVQNSCNPGFVKVGLDEGKERFYKYIRAFGFGQKTGINLTGEATGIVIPEKSVKPLDLATISIGQSISVTPIQLITAVSAIANDGVLMKPQLVRQITDNNGGTVRDFKPETIRQVISQSTARQLSGILEKVVSQGTGVNAYLKGYRIAGKTGTAQKAGKGGYSQGKYVASFAGFAPADDPKLAMLVVIDEPTGGQYYGGQIAAPIFKNLAKDILRYMNVTPQLSAEEIKENSDRAEILVPDIVNTSLEDAQRILLEAGMQAKIVGEGSWVINQQPKGGARFPSGTQMIVYLGQQGKGVPDGREVTVPDLGGMTMREAGQLLGRLGLQLEPQGTGIAHEQTPVSGTKIKTGTAVKVIFKPPESYISP